MKNRSHHGRKTIGVLIDWTVDPYQQLFLSGIMDFAKTKDANCIIFEGGGVGSPYEYETQRNVIYHLASDNIVDGLVILSASIAHFIGPDEAKSFCEKYRPLPLVSISMEIENAISVLVDNRHGMRELVVHLVEQHGFRRFGFVKGRIGNQDAIDRFNVFQEVLEEYHLPLDPRYIYQGDFTVNSGIEAAKDLIKKGVANIDVLVTSNDNMAMGAMQEIERRGIRIPDQIAVTGFDNIDCGDYLTPPLTTVRLPIYEQGWTAGKLLIDLLDNKEVPPKVYIPTKMVVRESCKCLSCFPPVRESKPKSNTIPSSSEYEEKEDALSCIHGITASILNHRTDLNLEEVTQKLGVAYGKGTLPRDQKAFLKVFDETVYLPMRNSIDYFSYRNMLCELWNDRSKPPRDHALGASIEDLYFHAIVNMGQKIVEKESNRLNEFLQEGQKLEVIRELLFTMDLSTEMDVLARRIPDMGIESCYVSLFKSNPSKDYETASCILGIRGKKRIEVGPTGVDFKSKCLVPDDFLSSREPYVLIVEAMKQFGFIVFETGSKPNRIFAYLSDIISGAVQGAVLYKELEEQKNDLDENLDRIRKAMGGFIQTMSATVETRDPYTAGHQRRVSDLARTIAQEMGLPPAQIDGVRMAGIIHDLGKIYIPAEILNRAGVLDDIEWSMIKKHPKVAYDILKNIDFPWPLADIVYQHHERINGTGYPVGLKGKETKLEARILAVADVVEAMSSHRPYRDALGIDQALEEINKNKGILYDSMVVDICTRLFQEKGYKFRTTNYFGIHPRKS